MPLIRLKKATPGNIVLIDFSSKHEVGKSSEKRVNPLRQKLVNQNAIIVVPSMINVGNFKPSLVLGTFYLPILKELFW